MDNSTEKVLNAKCRQFERLYHGSVKDNKYCIGTNIAQEYMCPLVSDGRIEEMPLGKWFSKQGTCNKNNSQCHQKQPLLGKYHLCPNQSMYSHYQEAPFQRGKFVPRNSNQPHQPNQQNQQKVYPGPLGPSDRMGPAQHGSGNRQMLLVDQIQKNPKPTGPMTQRAKPIFQAPVKDAPIAGSQKTCKSDLPTQTGGYVFTVEPRSDYGNVPSAHPDDPYLIYPAQEGYFVKRCIGDFNLSPNRLPSSYSLNQPIPPLSKRLIDGDFVPPIPPIASKVTMTSTTNPDAPSISVAGYAPTMNNLVVADTPAEMTNRYIMNYNIAPGYYPDMVPPNIGKRPVYAARNLESDIPEIITKNKPNFVGRDAGCSQPQWGPRCL